MREVPFVAHIIRREVDRVRGKTNAKTRERLFRATEANKIPDNPDSPREAFEWFEPNTIWMLSTRFSQRNLSFEANVRFICFETFSEK